MPVETIPIGDGKTLDIEAWTPEMNERFDKDFERLIAFYTEYSAPGGANIIRGIFESAKEAFRIIGQACKNDITPSPGAFNGVRAQTGYGMTTIRPDYLVPTAQGRTFDTSVSGLTANSWYGLWHNGTIGASYDATPLYLRKELGLGILGVMELSPSPIVEELQLEMNDVPNPVYNLVPAIHIGLRVARFPTVEYFKPANRYRSQAKFAAASGTTYLVPLGIAFVTAEWLRTTQPTQPSTTAP